MRIQSTLLAAAAVLAIAAPAAAFADPHDGGYRGGYSQDGRGYGYDGGQSGYRDQTRWSHDHCRRGVFYTSRSACAVHYGNGYGERGHDGRHDDGGHRFDGDRDGR